MKRLTLAVVGTTCLMLLAVGCTAEEKKAEPKDLKEKAAYSIGYNIGRDIKARDMEIDTKMLAMGARDAFAGTESVLTEEQMQEVMTTFQEEANTKFAAKMKAEADTNKTAGEAFLAENGKKEGVVTLENGLQYKVITEGTGAQPKVTDTVEVHYRGTLIDGTEFDSSYKREKPAVFGLGRVIPGWTQGLQLMKEGAKWELYVPSELAYGERGARGAIGPNATLIFEVELLKVNPTPEAPKAAE